MLDKPIKISERITIGLEPTADDLKSLAKDGYQTIINLSTKGELGQELDPEEAAKKAKKLGMQYLHLPISLSRLKTEQATEFITALNSLPEPVYVHCRIGQRSVPFGLLAYATKHKVSAEAALNHCDKLGITIDAPMISTFVKQCLKN